MGSNDIDVEVKSFDSSSSLHLIFLPLFWTNNHFVFLLWYVFKLQRVYLIWKAEFLNLTSIIVWNNLPSGVLIMSLLLKKLLHVIFPNAVAFSNSSIKILWMTCEKLILVICIRCEIVRNEFGTFKIMKNGKQISAICRFRLLNRGNKLHS